MLKGKTLTALVDSGSSESYISSSVSTKLNLNVYPSSHEVQKASPSVRVKSVGFCLVDITIKDTDYASTRQVLETLCSDIILGLDFLSQHQRLIFQFRGPSPDLVVSNERTCPVAAAAVKEVRLFAKLSPHAKPITTKSRRFSYEDQVFIREAVEKLLSDGVIRPSASPWRAQVLVKNEENRNKKRLYIDCPQTTSIYTELDAYPLPRINDMVNNLAKYSVFSTFDLRTAYHQIKITDSECKYTAFEANGGLYEFTRIPFGVKNGVAAFQRTIAQFIEEENLRDTFAYLDNVTVAGRDQDEHGSQCNSVPQGHPSQKVYVE